MDFLVHYAVAVRRADSKLMIDSDDERMHEQFAVTGPGRAFEDLLFVETTPKTTMRLKR